MHSKAIKLLFTLGLGLAAIGCQSLNNRFGNDNANYAKAKELPALKLPAKALPLSTRYDIPYAPDDNAPVVTEIWPANY